MVGVEGVDEQKKKTRSEKGSESNKEAHEHVVGKVEVWLGCGWREEWDIPFQASWPSQYPPRHHRACGRHPSPAGRSDEP